MSHEKATGEVMSAIAAGREISRAYAKAKQSKFLQQAWSLEKHEIIRDLNELETRVRKVFSDIEVRYGLAEEICQVSVKSDGSTNIARALGLKLTASSTSSVEIAVERVADKVFAQRFAGSGRSALRADLEQIRLTADGTLWALRWADVPF
jgi:hypothetical protein